MFQFNKSEFEIQLIDEEDIDRHGNGKFKITFTNGLIHIINVSVSEHDDSVFFRVEHPLYSFKIRDFVIRSIVNTHNGSEEEIRLAGRTVLVGALWYLGELNISWIRGDNEPCKWLEKVGVQGVDFYRDERREMMYDWHTNQHILFSGIAIP